MSFAQPASLLTLLAIPLAIAVYVLAQRRRTRYPVRFTNLDVLASVAAKRPSWRRYVAPVLFLAALAALGMGVARPRAHTMVSSERATVILVIDVSRSMQANDVRPTRLLAAEEAIRTFLDHAPKNLRVGLIAFAGEPQVAAPPSTNHDLVRQSLADLEYFGGFGGTAIGDALAAAVRLGKQTLEVGQAGGRDKQTIAYRVAAQPRKKPLVSILFLSDGAQTRGTLLPLDGARIAKKAGFPVYTVALGTPNGRLPLNQGQGLGGSNQGFSFSVPPDPETLHAIARTTGGRFVAAHDEKTLTRTYAQLGSSLGREAGTTEVTYAFLLGGMGLLLAAGIASAFWSQRL